MTEDVRDEVPLFACSGDVGELPELEPEEVERLDRLGEKFGFSEKWYLRGMQKK